MCEDEKQCLPKTTGLLLVFKRKCSIAKKGEFRRFGFESHEKARLPNKKSKKGMTQSTKLLLLV